jgi:putative RNA 2'-phosphotransferase
MISNEQVVNMSKYLSNILRHKPHILGLKLDKNGWANVVLLIGRMNLAGKEISRELLDFVVENNDKKRFSYDETGTKIRAVQGHTLKIDLAYVAKMPPDILFHGTTQTFIPSILKTGLEKRKRNHVHLSADFQTAIKVGKRRGTPVILRVFAQKLHQKGGIFYEADNGVWLIDAVPTSFLEIAEPYSTSRKKINEPTSSPTF